MDHETITAVLQRLAPSASPIPATMGPRDVAIKVFSELIDIRLLGPDTPGTIRLMERELLEFVGSRFGAESTLSAIGLTTWSGSCSIFDSIRAAKLRWRQCGGTGVPVAIFPTSAHPSFQRACQILDIEAKEVSIDSQSGTPLAMDVVRQLSAQTAYVGLSAPSSALGLIDPIEEVSKHCLATGTWLHVDACAGWSLPWLQEAEVGVPAFDFRLPGVTSISVDPHKFGPAFSGCSALFIRQAEVPSGFHVPSTRWVGYPYVAHSVFSSRSAGHVGATWAATLLFGVDGFRRLAHQLADVLAVFRSPAFAERSPLRVLGVPCGQTVGFRVPAQYDLVQVALDMVREGVPLVPVWSYRDFESVLSLSLNGVSPETAKGWLATLERKNLRELPATTGVQSDGRDRRLLELVVSQAAVGRGGTDSEAVDRDPWATRLKCGHAMDRMLPDDRDSLMTLYGELNSRLFEGDEN